MRGFGDGLTSPEVEIAEGGVIIDSKTLVLMFAINRNSEFMKVREEK